MNEWKVRVVKVVKVGDQEEWKIYSHQLVLVITWVGMTYNTNTTTRGNWGWVSSKCIQLTQKQHSTHSLHSSMPSIQSLSSSDGDVDDWSHVMCTKMTDMNIATTDSSRNWSTSTLWEREREREGEGEGEKRTMNHQLILK